MEKYALTAPASYTRLLKSSLDIYRRSFLKIFVLSLILSIIIFLPGIISDISNKEVFFMSSIFDLRRLWLIVIDLFSMLVLVAILWHIHCIMFGIKEPFIEDLQMGLRKLFYVFIACVIQTLFIFAAIFLIYGFQFVLFRPQPVVTTSLWGSTIVGLIFGLQIVFIIYVASLFLFYVPIIATEKKGVINALKRSISVAWNHWWRIISLQLTPWVVYTFVLIVLKYLMGLNIHFYFTERKIYTLQVTILHLLLFTFFIPWVCSLLLVQLNDLELRKKLALKHAK